MRNRNNHKLNLNFLCVGCCERGDGFNETDWTNILLIIYSTLELFMVCRVSGWWVRVLRERKSKQSARWQLSNHNISISRKLNDIDGTLNDLGLFKCILCELLGVPNKRCWIFDVDSSNQMWLELDYGKEFNFFFLSMKLYFDYLFRHFDSPNFIGFNSLTWCLFGLFLIFPLFFHFLSLHLSPSIFFFSHFSLFALFEYSNSSNPLESFVLWSDSMFQLRKSYFIKNVVIHW